MLKVVAKHSQKALARATDGDGLVTVYRGETRPKGKSRSGALSVSLSPQIAARFAMDQGGKGHQIRAFRVKPEDVLMDVSASGKSKIVKAERELLVNGDVLTAGEVADIGTIGTQRSADEARKVAIQIGKDTGDPEVAAAVEDVVDLFARYAEKLGSGPNGIGRLENPRIGYFPIFNVGKWRVSRTSMAKGGADEFGGAYATIEEATEAATRIMTETGEKNIFIMPVQFSFQDSMLSLDPKDYGRLMGKMAAAAETSLDEAALKAFKDELKKGVVPSRAAAPTYAGILRERTLGLRDYAMDDMFDAMGLYMGQADRLIALHDFKNRGTTLLNQLPPSAHGGGRLQSLQGWGERLMDDVLGKPTRNEIIVDNFIRHLGLDEHIKPRALKRWSGFVRGVESVSRLAGAASGAVNLTQISINTTTVVGPKYTAIAMAELFNPRTGSVTGNFKRIRQQLVDLGVDQVDMFVPLANEAGLPVHAQASTLVEDISRAAKRATTSTKNRQYRDAVRDYTNVASTSLLFAFNGAERINRVVTARAQYLKSIAEQKTRGTVVSPRAAAAEANRAVARTQFDYRMSNMPELFRDPAFATAFQFKSFLVNEIDFIAHLSGPEMRRFSMGLAATGGVAVMLNMAPVDMLDTASSVFFDKSLSDTLATDVIGNRNNMLTKAVSYGIPGLLGVNIADYAGIGGLKEITRGVTGPGLADAAAIANFFKEAVADNVALGYIRDETRNELMQKIMPSFARRLGRGIAILETGNVNDPVTGQLIYKPAERNRSAAWTAVGFPTLEYSQRRAVADIAGRVKDRYIRANQDLSKGAAEAILEGRGAAVQNMRNRAREAGFELSDRSIKYQMKNLQRDASERVLRRTPVQRRQDVTEAMEITGTLPEGVALPQSDTPVFPWTSLEGLDLGPNPFQQ